jgi:hypothetical protein
MFSLNKLKSNLLWPYSSKCLTISLLSSLNMKSFKYSIFYYGSIIKTFPFQIKGSIFITNPFMKTVMSMYIFPLHSRLTTFTDELAGIVILEVIN